MDKPLPFQAAVDALLALPEEDQLAHLRARFSSNDRDSAPRLQLPWGHRPYEDVDAEEAGEGRLTRPTADSSDVHLT